MLCNELVSNPVRIPTSHPQVGSQDIGSNMTLTRIKQLLKLTSYASLLFYFMYEAIIFVHKYYRGCASGPGSADQL